MSDDLFTTTSSGHGSDHSATAAITATALNSAAAAMTVVASSSLSATASLAASGMTYVPPLDPPSPPLQIDVHDPISVEDASDAKVGAPWWQRAPKLALAGLGTLLNLLLNLDRILRLIERAPEWYEKAKELLRDLCQLLRDL